MEELDGHEVIVTTGGRGWGLSKGFVGGLSIMQIIVGGSFSLGQALVPSCIHMVP